MEQLEKPVEEKPRGRFRFLVTVLIILVTMLGAFVAYLQTDASIKEDKAIQRSQELSIRTMGEILRSGMDTSHDLRISTDYTVYMMESVMQQMVAQQLRAEGQDELAVRFENQAAVWEALANYLRPFSVLLSDPRYATGDEFAPDAAQYLADSSAAAMAMLAEQNEAAAQADLWGNKADLYVSVLTVLAISLFLYGLSLALSTWIRYLFALVGTIVAGACALWTLVILIG